MWRRYVIVADSHIAFEREWKKFEKFLDRACDIYDKVVLAGDILLGWESEEVRRKIEERENVVYIRGNHEEILEIKELTEPCAVIDGWLVVHGHQYEPRFDYPFSKIFEITDRLLKSERMRRAAKKFGEKIKGGKDIVVAITIGRIYRSIKRAGVKGVILGHFHIKGTYRIGDKLVVYLPPYPSALELDGGQPVFYRNILSALK